jgi:hypothetical protein
MSQSPEKNHQNDFLPEKLMTAELGSPQSRAAARALLVDRWPYRPPPVVIIEFVSMAKPGAMIEAGDLPLEPDLAETQLPGSPGRREFHRQASETRQQFIDRITATLPALRPGMIVLSHKREPRKETNAAPVSLNIG